jgi:hypothetical protein
MSDQPPLTNIPEDAMIDETWMKLKEPQLIPSALLFKLLKRI